MNVKQASISAPTHRPAWTSTDGTSVWTQTGARSLMYRCLRSEWHLVKAHTLSHTFSQLLKYVLAISSEYNQPLYWVWLKLQDYPNYFFHIWIQLCNLFFWTWSSAIRKLLRCYKCWIGNRCGSLLTYPRWFSSIKCVLEKHEGKNGYCSIFV